MVKPPLLKPRRDLVEVARRFVGLRETSKNQGPGLAQFWPYTLYPEGYANREPYCCAFVVAVIAMAAKEFPALQLRARPTMADCRGLLAWARNGHTGCLVFTPESKSYHPQAGDIFTLLPKVSHVGFIAADCPPGATVIHTIEANTNDAGSREGDGIYAKTRPRSAPGFFIRLPLHGEEP